MVTRNTVNLQPIHAEVVENPHVDEDLISVLLTELPRLFGEGIELLLRHLEPLGRHAHAARLAERLRGQLVVVRVVREVFAALEGDLLLRGANPEVAVLAGRAWSAN